MAARLLTFGNNQETADFNSFGFLTDHELMHFQELLCRVLGEKGRCNLCLNRQLLDNVSILREPLCEDIRPIAGHRGFGFLEPSPNDFLSESSYK